MTRPYTLIDNPLQEVMFQLHWELSLGDNGFYDPEYESMLAKFHDSVKAEYPDPEKVLNATGPNQARMRFKRKPEVYPLLQLGHGMMAVNDTKNYNWEIFSQVCNYAVERFADSRTNNYTISALQLKYLDIFPLGDMNIDEFMSDGFGYKVSCPGDIDDHISENSPEELRMTLSYKLKNDLGYANISFLSGNYENDKSLIVDTTIHKNSPSIESLTDVDQWLADVHSITHKLFISMLDGHLKEKYLSEDNKNYE